MTVQLHTHEGPNAALTSPRRPTTVENEVARREATQPATVTHDGSPSFREIQAMADVLAESSMVPATYKRQPANIILAALTGRPLGWDVTASMRNITVIQGTATIKPEAMLGMVRAAGHSVSGTTTNTAATVTGRRRDTADEMTFTYAIEDAQRAKLASKDNWKNYPASMLWARAVAQLCRMLFPDVLLGLSYVPDEAGAVTDERGEVIEGDISDQSPNLASEVPAQKLVRSVLDAFVAEGLDTADASRWWAATVDPEAKAPRSFPREEATLIWQEAKNAAVAEAARQAAGAKVATPITNQSAEDDDVDPLPASSEYDAVDAELVEDSAT